MSITADLTRTIYSIAWPETHEILKEVHALDHTKMFSDTWSKKQDAMHLPYMNKWKKVFNPYISFDEEKLKFGYPTNGSSESINMILANLNTKGFELVIFNEEYEGYAMVAKNLSMKIHTVSRNNYKKEISDLISSQSSKLVMFTSQPSSIDGNYWEEFNDYISFLENTGIRLYIDVAYAGSFEHKQIKLDNYSCVDGVIYSLSKCFGVYYHRIGGCFLKEENPLLWPMLWFKNMMSIQYAIFLMSAFENGQYKNTRAKVKELQNTIVNEMSKEFGLNVLASDVPMIAMVELDEVNHPWQTPYLRGENKKYIRVCISKNIEKRLYAV